MLHDTVLALLGIPGDIYLKTDEGIYFIICQKLAKSIHPSELNQLSKIGIYGGTYGYVKEFCDSILSNISLSNEIVFRDTSFPKSLYLLSFAKGVDDAIASYRNKVNEIEKLILSNEFITLSHLILKIDNYLQLFNYITEIINLVEERKISGIEIFENITRFKIHPSPLISQSFKIIFRAMSHVLSVELTSIVIYGIVNDPFRELFILQSNNIENRVYILRDIQGCSFLSYETKLKIRTIVEIINCINKIQYNAQYTEDDHMIKYLDEIKQLYQFDDFDWAKFEGIINEIHLYMINKLWKKISSEFDISNFFDLIKNIYFTGDGEFFLTLLEGIYNYIIFDKTYTDHDSHRISKILSYACSQCNSSYDDTDEVIHLKMNIPEQQEFSITDLPIGLEAYTKLPPNIELLFSIESFKSLNNIFKHLLTLKLILFLINKCWELIIKNGKIMKFNTKNEFRLCSSLIHQIKFFLHVLIDYSIMDVIEPYWNEIKILLTSDFDIIRFNELFSSSIKKITLNLAIDEQSIPNVLSNIVRNCVRLHQSLLTFTESNKDEYISSIIQNIQSDFDRNVELFFFNANRIISSDASSIFKHLIIKLDFNHFYSSKFEESPTICLKDLS